MEAVLEQIIQEDIQVKKIDTQEIDKIIKKLKAIVLETSRDNPNLAYFAILYMYVTIKVKENITIKAFEGNTRMERLDVIFAMRYIDAYDDWKNGNPISESWKIAFEFGQEKNSMIMQHLLLGMNAHINLDLGIATVEATSSKEENSNDYKGFNAIIGDFTKINQVLNELTTTVEKCLASSSFFFGLIRKYGKNKEAILADFSVKYARTGAWYFASFYRKNKNNKTIKERDQDIYKLALEMTNPRSFWIKSALTLGALTEVFTAKKFIPKMIEELDKMVSEDHRFEKI